MSIDPSKLKEGEPSYYIAIGTSAGGLEALQEFVQHMPHDSGAAFIVIQHLSPDFKSVMDELLGRHTKMPVYNATEGVSVCANTIYLIPPRKNMMIAEGKLLLVDQMRDQGINFPIDIFFRSLAEDQHHRTISVVLSGTGSDGSRGIQAIKEVGGLVIVQEPTDAKFDGMPYNAVKTGYADLVAPASEIPAKIVQYITHPMVNSEEDSLVKRVEDSENALHEIYELLKERSDIDFSQYKGSTIARRIERRIGINGLSNVQDYYAFLLKKPQEINTLSKDMLIGVTRFFRDDDAFSNMEKEIIPSIFKDTPLDEPIRIWVAGCSSGEEAYSLAIIFDEEMRKRGEARSIKIFATDVDPTAIAEASAGQYDPNIRADVSEERLQKYFTATDESYTVIPSLRQMVVFATHNLIKDPPFSNTQLATCRNVLIYFQPKAQRRILSMLHFSIQKQGYLFLGGSETLGDLQSYFEVCDERNRIYRKTVATRIMSGTMPPISSSPTKAGTTPSVDHLLRSYQQFQKPTQHQPVLEQLVKDYVPPCIIINEEYEVVHVYGDVNAYTQKLKSGRFSANINDFIHEDLSIAVSTALHKASTKKETIEYNDVHFRGLDDKEMTISLRAMYIKPSSLAAAYIALMFDDEKIKAELGERSAAVKYNISDQSRERIRDLENQLQKKQEHLQVTIEELETTNEELQSSNEELLAANEELQSTNEELQSVNEELYTVNSEYQEKIEELTQVNNDLDNIITFSDIGLVFLDDAMLIRKYSPVATRTINLLPSDIGRPFHHISHKLNYDLLLQNIATVIEKGNIIEKEVFSEAGKPLLLKLAPYLDDMKISCGCVISITDLSEIRQLQQKLVDSYSELRSTIDATFWASKTNINVLIVDDNEVDLMSVKNALAKAKPLNASYVVKTTDTVDHALQLLKEENFDICVMDFNLGNGTAFDIIKNINNEVSTAFIIMSGNMDEELARQSIEYGIYDMLDKATIGPDLIDRSIRYTLRHKKTELYLKEQTN